MELSNTSEISLKEITIHSARFLMQWNAELLLCFLFSVAMIILGCHLETCSESVTSVLPKLVLEIPQLAYLVSTETTNSGIRKIYGRGRKKGKKKKSVVSCYILKMHDLQYIFLCDGLLESSRNEYTLNFVCKM